MVSKFCALKPDAIQMRLNGVSLRDIEIALKVPRSTLSNWLKHVYLTEEQKLLLIQRQKMSLIIARIKASTWHKQQKIHRIQIAEQEAKKLILNLNIQDKSIQQLAAAMLYIGEGFKSKPELGIGNSNPLILRFFIAVIINSFSIKKDLIRCELYLRADQDLNKEKSYWSKELEIPIKNFIYASFDKRTIGRPTYDHYHGVCTLRFGNSNIQRKLLAIANNFCIEIGQLAQR